MRGTARQRGPGKWQIQVYAGRDETSGRDIRVTRSVAAPHTRAGKKVVDQALAALIVEVETGRINLGDDPTLAELLDRWMAARGARPRLRHVHPVGRDDGCSPVAALRPAVEQDRAAADFLDDLLDGTGGG